MRNRGISIIIIFHKRHQHLLKVLKGIEMGRMIPDEVILIEMDTQKSFIPESLLDIKHYIIDTANYEHLPIAEARNLGAYWSTNDVLAFLDVDCVPSKNYICQIEQSQIEDGCLYMGTPKYLNAPIEKVTQTELESCSKLHPHRPNFEVITSTEDYGMFWSLTFFLTHDTFSKIDGFDTGYTGYGAEDTDFAFKARKLEIPFYLTPFIVYHQQHSFCRPPLNNMKAIVENCNYFYSKWNHWPMSNHLEAFASENLIDWNPEQNIPIKIVNKPTELMIENALVLDEPYA